MVNKSCLHSGTWVIDENKRPIQEPTGPDSSQVCWRSDKKCNTLSVSTIRRVPFQHRFHTGHLERHSWLVTQKILVNVIPHEIFDWVNR